MSRRTFIKQWNPAVPIGGRGRGRRKKGDDPDQVFKSAYRTVHDPSVNKRRPAGRDDDGSTHFYSASGLNAAGLPVPEDRFRSNTLPTRGGRGGLIQPRFGMFRNAVQSNIIFGGPSERMLRNSRRKIERLLAPDSDVPESVNEWRQSPQRRTKQRRDVYEYDSEEEDDDLDVQPRRRVSNSRRISDHRKDPDYDPYEFQDDDSGEETFNFQPPTHRKSSNSKLTRVQEPSRVPTAYARERLRSKDERVRPRRLFDGASDDEEEECDRRVERRGDKRKEQPVMEKRNSKRARELSPAKKLPTAAARRPVVQRETQQLFEPSADSPKDRPRKRVEANKETSNSHYTPSIAQKTSRRVMSGLPPIRLKNDDGSESYLSVSRSIISGALVRLLTEEPEDGDGDPPDADGEPSRNTGHAGQSMMLALLNRTHQINVSDESEEEEGEEGEHAENMFSRHAREDSPVLERLYDQTIREAASHHGDSDEDEEVDTANMLGLGDVVNHGLEADPFAIAPRTAGESTSSGSGSVAVSDPFSLAPRTAGESPSPESTIAALFKNKGHRHIPMAASQQSMALMATTREQQRIAAGTRDSSRPFHLATATVGASNEQSFHLQMNGSSRSTVPLNDFQFPPPVNYVQNDNASYNFEF